MEMVMDVLFGIGGVFILLACVAGCIAILIAVHEVATFAGSKLARNRPTANVVAVCRWVYLAAALVAMSLSFVLVDGTAKSVGAFIAVLVLKGILGALIAAGTAFLVSMLVGRPFLRAFDAEIARANHSKTIIAYV